MLWLSVVDVCTDVKLWMYWGLHHAVIQVNITKRLLKLGKKRLVDAQFQLIMIYYDALHAW